MNSTEAAHVAVVQGMIALSFCDLQKHNCVVNSKHRMPVHANINIICYDILCIIYTKPNIKTSIDLYLNNICHVFMSLKKEIIVYHNKNIICSTKDT